MLKDRGVTFRIGEWTVLPELNTLVRDGVERHIEPKVMKVLLVLASDQGRVVPKEKLISLVWPDTFVSDDVLTRCISILRRITDDDAHTPRYIQTIPKTGYRLVAEVTEIVDDEKGLALAPLHTEQDPAAHLPENLVGPESGLRADTAALHSHDPQASGLRLIAVILVVLLAAFVAAGVWFFRMRSRAGANLAFQTIQFTSYAGEQTQPAFSPDGKRIAFVWLSEDGSSRRIYIKTIGSQDAQLLNTPQPGETEDQYSPAWSPDGRQIAYLSSAKDALGLYVADVAAKTPPRKLLIPEVMTHWENGAVSWAPSGKALIYSDHLGIEPHSSIFQVDLDSLSTRSITTPPAGWEGDMNPAYSPNGRWIAFTRSSETAVQDLFCMSTVDNSVRQLTHDGVGIDSLAWTADSKGIVFSSSRGGKYALWKIGLNAREPERLPYGTEDAYQPAVGPKPGELAYTQGSAIWSILQVGEGMGAEKAVLTSTQQDSAPSLAPDGHRFAFQSHRSGNQEIWIASLGTNAPEAGQRLRQLTYMNGPLTGSPAWSHEGDKVVFDSRPDGHSHIFCVPVGGGKPKQLTFGNVNDITPRWSHDDKTIYFRSNRGDRWQIWKVPASGGDPQPVTTGDGIVPQESPDGAWLYFTRGAEDGLWRVAPTGGAETQVLPQPVSGYWGYWQVTSRGIFFLDHAAASNTIRLFDPATGKTTLFATLRQMPPSNAGITVTNDGRVLLMSDQRDAERHITLIQAMP